MADIRMRESLPLARALRPRLTAARLPVRVTPARAGSITPRRAGRPSPPCHSRSRGLHSPIQPKTGDAYESPPLARALPSGPNRQLRAGQFTPARAGFTREPISTRPCSTGHPRSRGLYHHAWFVAHHVDESRPLARALHELPAAEVWQARVTPACAGSTHRRINPQANEPCHSRSRGLYGGSRPASTRRVGSLPLARALLRRHLRHHHTPRVTPARAGSAKRRSPFWTRSPSHSRSRGPYANLTADEWFEPASFLLARAPPKLTVGQDTSGLPLARASSEVDEVAGHAVRVTPACAGSTLAISYSIAATPRHSRSRGLYRNSRSVRPPSGSLLFA